MNTNPIAYRISEKYDQNQGENWDKYIIWKNCSCKRIISLDTSLCPSVIDVLSDEDWTHKVYPDIFFDAFDSILWINRKVPSKTHNHQILAVQKFDVDNQIQDILLGFRFIGYDMIENETMISAITNCIHFDLAYSSDDLNEFGLISEANMVKEISLRLVKYYPDESHANVSAWAIWEKLDK